MAENELQKGCILKGINNIYSVLYGDEIIECRIKGKQLSEEQKSYNPLAPGDMVTIEPDPIDTQYGMILERMDRKNKFVRFNKKRQSPQVIAANVDLIVCLASVKSPPFRPRFIDRVLVSAFNEIPVAVVLNKTDQGIKEDIQKRMDNYKTLGHATYQISVKNNIGIEDIYSLIHNKRVVFIGQSGVGKSSLCNALNPELGQKIGAISSKHNRGKHTTCFSEMFKWKDESELIDTPGIREIEVYGINAPDLKFYFPEFKPFTEKCQFNGCNHIHEPGCAVLQAVEDGLLNEDRFTSYNSIYEELDERYG